MSNDSITKRHRIREYDIIKIIGRGGMGAVFKAQHRKLKTFRALKILKSDLINDQKFVLRFEREARVMARLDHPNVLKVYEFFQESKYLVLVMEFLTGETLAERLKRLRVLDIKEVLDIMLQTCRGLGHAHDLGVIHRDLAPDNLMITKSGCDEIVKVIDFGIAKAIADGGSTFQTQLTSTGMFMGKVTFCSPEQAAGQSLDQRSDLYSLGLIMARALTGRTPFYSVNPLECIENKFRLPTPTLEILRPDFVFPNMLETIFARLIAREPMERYCDVYALENDLIIAQQRLNQT